MRRSISELPLPGKEPRKDHECKYVSANLSPPEPGWVPYMISMLFVDEPVSHLHDHGHAVPLSLFSQICAPLPMHKRGCLACSVIQGSLPEGDEIIVVDGGSADRTISVAKKHGAKV